MDEQLEQLAAELGVPADLISRAAAARASASGVGVEALVAGWAGSEAPAAAPAAEPAASGEPAPASSDPVPSDAAPAASAAPAAPAEVASPAVEVLEGEAPPTPPDDEAGPDAEAGPDEEEGERSPALSGFPKWLAAAFLVVPVVALLYAMVVPSGPDCGSAGQLAVDPVTGQAANCEGGLYGVDVVNGFNLGEPLYEARCVACHGEAGGGGAGPALTGGSVLVTFPSGQCSDHLEWVTLGTAAWPDATYGAAEKPVAGFGTMPGFGNTLTDVEIAQIVVYERVAFGGQSLPDAETDCGVAHDGTVVAGG